MPVPAAPPPPTSRLLGCLRTWLTGLSAAFLAGCDFAFSTPLRLVGARPEEGPHVVIVTSAVIRTEMRGAFVRESRRLLEEMQSADGLLATSIRFQPLGSRVWTLTAWRSREHARAFAGSAGHRRARQAMDRALVSFRSATRELPATAFPPSWQTALPWLEDETAPAEAP